MSSVVVLTSSVLSNTDSNTTGRNSTKQDPACRPRIPDFRIHELPHSFGLV